MTGERLRAPQAMNLRSLILISLMGSALAFGQDDEELIEREPIWKRARNAAERAIERGDFVRGQFVRPGDRCRLDVDLGQPVGELALERADHRVDLGAVESAHDQRAARPDESGDRRRRRHRLPADERYRRRPGGDRPGH